MQKFNPNFTGRNRGVLTMTKPETDKELNDLNARKPFSEKLLKSPKNMLNQTSEMGRNQGK